MSQGEIAQTSQLPREKAKFDRRWLGAIALLVLTFVTYLPALRAQFIWDDDDYIWNNPTLNNVHGLAAIWGHERKVVQYYPLTLSMFWAEHQLWGNDPTGYHVTNVMLHGVSVVLLWLILRKLDVPGAWLAAAIWAIHPVNVESVAWATEGKNVLSGVFYLAAFLVYLSSFGGWTDPPTNAGQAPRLNVDRVAAYVVAFLLLVCALLSKTTASTWPAAMLLVIWWKRGRISWRDVVRLVPFFVVGIAAGQLTAYFERTYIHASGADFDLSNFDRVIIAGRAIWFYFFKLVFPANLMFIYPRWELARWMIVYLLAALAVVAGLIIRKRRSALTGVLFFIGTLVPALGFVNVYPMKFSFVADHFQYLASIGIIALLVAGGTKLFGKNVKVPAIAVLLGLAVLTWQRAAVFHDLITLWGETREKNPDSWIVRANFGGAVKERADELARQGQMDSAKQLWAIAEEEFLATIRLRPTQYQQMENLAVIYAEQGDLQRALDWQKRAESIAPWATETHQLAADFLEKLGRHDEALVEKSLAQQQPHQSAQ